MMGFIINEHWFYFPSINDQYLMSDPLFVIKDLCSLMIELFDFEPIYDLQIIDFMDEIDSPICLHDCHQILLSTSGNFFCYQNAYQLAHELCHYMIREKSGINNNSWLEESICELSSIYFLDCLSNLWLCSSDQDKQASYINFHNYIYGISQKRTSFDISDLSDKKTNAFKHMNQDKYLRDKNACIAFMLFPIFRNHCTLWKDIHLIRKYDPKNLPLLFDEWEKDAAQKNKEAIDLIRKIFIKQS